MQKYNKFLVVILAICFIAGPISAFAATAPTLGTSSSFAVLGASTVTNTGSTVLHGDLGLNPGTSITGFFGTTANDGPGVFTGYSVHQTDATAGLAQTAATGVYNAMTAQSCGGNDLSGQDLGGMTLTPGVYCFSSSAQLTGTLTLNAQGNPNAVWIFQIGSTLITASSSSVVFSNGGSNPGCNVFWQVGSSATIGTSSSFVGTVVTAHDATLNTNATVYGRILARGVSADGAVTLDTNSITVPTCASVVNGACGTANGSVVSVAPTTNLCSSGSASSVAGSGPWTWTCAGSNGGTNSSICTATASAPATLTLIKSIIGGVRTSH